MRSVGWKSFVAHFGVLLSISSCGQVDRGNPEPSATTPEQASTSEASKQASGRLTDAKSAAPRSAGEHGLNLASPPVPLAFVTVETAVWEQKVGAGPAARYEHSLAFDGTRGKVVLFGGRADDLSSLGDTWLWDGTSWANVTPASSPSARRAHSLAYDGAREKVFLFGGDQNGVSLNDSWEWDGTGWTNVTPASSPPARRYHALAYDSAREKLVLFGGSPSGALVLDDTWE